MNCSPGPRPTCRYRDVADGGELTTPGVVVRVVLMSTGVTGPRLCQSVASTLPVKPGPGMVLTRPGQVCCRGWGLGIGLQHFGSAMCAVYILRRSSSCFLESQSLQVAALFWPDRAVLPQCPVRRVYRSFLRAMMRSAIQVGPSLGRCSARTLLQDVIRAAGGAARARVRLLEVKRGRRSQSFLAKKMFRLLSGPLLPFCLVMEAGGRKRTTRSFIPRGSLSAGPGYASHCPVMVL